MKATNNLSRRTILSGAAAIPAAALPVLPSLAATDPIYAAIEAHQAAHVRYCAAVLIPAEMLASDPGFEEADAKAQIECDAAYQTAYAILDTEPTTLAGLAAFLTYVVEFKEGGRQEWPDREKEPNEAGPGETVSFEDDVLEFAARTLRSLAA